MRPFLTSLLGFLLLAPSLVQSQQPMLILPTENQGLLHDGPASFYECGQRDFEGQVSQPWEGGQYGFVRNPVRFGSAIIYTRFHEGIDICPLSRNASGEPTDVVHAIAEGKVAYTNTAAGSSNYGKICRGRAFIRQLSLLQPLRPSQRYHGEPWRPGGSKRSAGDYGSYRRGNRSGASACPPRA